jgi:agmatine deiminase
MSPVRPEWEPHERTIMGWPCRVELWDDIDDAKEDYAAVANAIADFEPVLMVVNSEADAAEARAMLASRVEVWQAPIDDSWLRDSGPIFTGTEAVCFGFNAWGRKFEPYDADQRIAPLICDHLGRPYVKSDLILEGGSIAIAADGAIITTEQCLLNPNRNPTWSKDQIEQELLDRLGAPGVIWLGAGLVEDRDTDGHVDMICVPTESGEVLLQWSDDEDNPNLPRMDHNRKILESHGYEVILFDVLAYGDNDAMSYLNAYICNGAVIVPTSGQEELDERALEIYRLAFPEHEPIPVPGMTIAAGGGGPHCITQQVPFVTVGYDDAA